MIIHPLLRNDVSWLYSYEDEMYGQKVTVHVYSVPEGWGEIPLEDRI